jgi:hypothetical protein
MKSQAPSPIAQHAASHTNGNDSLLPSWVIKLARRLLTLPHGRYQLILTIGPDCDWTVVQLGKVERNGKAD